MKSLFYCVLVLAAPSVYAQLSQSDSLDQASKQYTYPEIVITAPRVSMSLKETPFSATIVERSILRELPRSVAADEPMKLIPGIKVDNQANGERVHLSMRGQGILTERGIRGIKILMDGIPLNDPTGFAPDFFDVDFAAIDRIEVLHGPAASLYGGSASGGILNLVTQTPPSVASSGTAQLSLGSNNFWKGFGQVGGTTGDLGYTVSLSRTMGDGYREHTHFSGNNVYAKGIYNPTDQLQITPIVGYVRVRHENPEGINMETYLRDPRTPNDDAIPFNEFLQTERGTGGAKGRFVLSDAQELNALAFVKRTEFVEANNHTFNHRTITSPGTSIDYAYSMGGQAREPHNRVMIGLDYQWQTIDQHEQANDHALELSELLSKEQIRQRSVGLFVVDKLMLDPVWTLVGSLRYDNIHNELEDLLSTPNESASGSANFSKATGRVGVIYALTPEANLFANWGQGFLPPATEELALNPDAYAGFNTHLSSATSQGVELGSRGWFRNDAAYELTLFYLATDNDFDRYRLPDRGQTTFYKNSGPTRRFGAELGGRYAPMHDVEFRLAYTFSDFRYREDSPTPIAMDDESILKYIRKDNFLPNSPQHELYADVRVRPVEHAMLGFGVEAFSTSYIDGANLEAEAVHGYALLDARAAYEWQLNDNGLTAEVSISGRNLGNTKYVAFSEPDPGGNSYQPGAGREFFGGLRIHW
jgi:iron complex outermembrane receptor protein